MRVGGESSEIIEYIYGNVRVTEEMCCSDAIHVKEVLRIECTRAYTIKNAFIRLCSNN